MISKELLSILPASAPTVQRTYKTHIRAIDSLLGSGLISGQTLEWCGGLSCGKTGVLRALVHAVQSQGTAVAYIDARRELLAADWCGSFAGRLWVVRPPDPAHSLFCAETMLRAQSFGLVVVDGAREFKGNLASRLQRLARQSGSGLIVTRRLEQRPITGKVHARISFSSRVMPLENPCNTRGVFTWSVQMGSRRTSQPDKQRDIYLTEPSTAERLSNHRTPDRPANRVSALKRYGR